MTKKQKIEARDESIAALRSLGLEPGSRVYTTVTHVSRSGMSRRIKCFIPGVQSGHRTSDPTKREPCIIDISWHVARVIDARQADDGGMVIGGCGMDMGFHVVYTLARVMFPDGGPVAHSVRRHQEERSGATREKDGGYLLRQEWL